MPCKSAGRSQHGAPARVNKRRGSERSWISFLWGQAGKVRADQDLRNNSHGDWIRHNEYCGLYAMSPDAPLDALMAAKLRMLKSYQERKEFYDSVMWD